MYSALRALALKWARVAPQPDPPIGAPGSARVFRAGKNYYFLRLAGWGAGQIGAVIGLLFSIAFVGALESAFETATRIRALPRPASAAPAKTPKDFDDFMAQASAGNAAAVSAAPSPSPGTSAVAASPNPQESPRPSSRRSRNRNGLLAIQLALQRMPELPFTILGWFVPVFVFLEYAGVLAFFTLFPLTYALVRVEFEQHWYIVTDRSLRIRTGVIFLSEATMSFANLQQVEVKQGPLQRLLGLADVRIRSAGGGGGSESGKHDQLHTGIFRNVENAEEIRDLIVERLKRFREAGLGDPDHDRPRTRSQASIASALTDTLAASRELLAEARALRLTTAQPQPGRFRAGNGWCSAP